MTTGNIFNRKGLPMWMFYLIALVPLVAGFFLWLFSKRITWWEWGLSAVAGFIVSGAFHLTAIHMMTSDEEMRSGRVTSVRHDGQWVEEYQQMHTKTVGSGKNARTVVYYTTEHATHYEKWTAHVSYGSQDNTYDISSQTYLELQAKFGGGVDEKGVQSCTHGGHYDGGDRNYYITRNKTGYLRPANKFTSFENRVKAAPTVFSYVKVPENAPVFAYPKFIGWGQSDRLKGNAASRISIYDWDCMNSRLGPDRKVNVILVGFDSTDSELGQLQESKYIGGKKNDLVLTYGVDASGKTVWAYVFGWTEKTDVKRNLETILMSSRIDNSIIPIIEKEIFKNYVIKDWTKFDYITIEPPVWSYFVLLLVMFVVQFGYYIWALNNYCDGTDIINSDGKVVKKADVNAGQIFYRNYRNRW